MAVTRVSKIRTTPDGEVVYAIGDMENRTGFRLICSGCPDRDIEYRSCAGALLAVSYHADLDPEERFVPTKDTPPPSWRTHGERS
jgi:hypothetical protein